jgi:hypothetical protein
MYIEMIVTEDEWLFQLRSEDGTAIGAQLSFDNAENRLERDEQCRAYQIYPGTQAKGQFPPLASFPFDRTVLLPNP